MGALQGQRPEAPNSVQMTDQLKRWRLLLGGEEDATGAELSGEDLKVDGSLQALYGGTQAQAQGRSRTPSR